MPQSSVFVEVREPHTNRLLFRYDAARRLVEIVDRKVKTVVDLTQYEATAPESAERDADERLQCDQAALPSVR